MKPKTRKIYAEESTLPPVERAELIERIIESSDAEPDESFRKAWEAEAERRLSEYRNEKAAVVSEDEVFYRIETGRNI